MGSGYCHTRRKQKNGVKEGNSHGVERINSYGGSILT